MYKYILAATDGTEIANRALEHAAALSLALDAKLTIVTVTEQAPSFDSSEIGWSVPRSVFDDIRRANVQKSHALLEAAARNLGVPATLKHVEDQRPAEGILLAANATNADLLVMGSNGHSGFQRLVLGSQVAKVLGLATIPVLVIRPRN